VFFGPFPPPSTPLASRGLGGGAFAARRSLSRHASRVGLSMQWRGKGTSGRMPGRQDEGEVEPKAPSEPVTVGEIPASP